MGNFENAIKQNLFFFENWNEYLKLSSNEGDDLTTTNGNLIASWNIYNDLGYLYNRIFEYETAKSYYEKVLALTSLEDNFIIRFPIEHEGINDFDVFISNYLFCLEKTRDYAKCVEVLGFVTSKLPNNIYYSKQKLRFEEKIKQIGLGEEIIKQASPRKTPFNIAKFSPTKILAREKALEEMIIEQIKYGFKVFGKALELYVSSSIYGRQFAIPGINGILDLLLIDKASDTLYVVELKRNEAGIEVVEQIERYMEGLAKHLKQKVKGIICLHKPDEQLKLMVRSKPDIELFTYHFDFKQEE
jgi:tetratricopeptide (TPR) repeat protein